VLPGPVVPGGAAVLDLAALRAADAARVGPKMARLGQLAADGWRVPDGYAVTASALDGWLPPVARAELERIFTGAGGDRAPVLELAGIAARARTLIEAQPLPTWLADAVTAAHGRLQARLASRSTGRSTGQSTGRGGQPAEFLVAVR